MTADDHLGEAVSAFLDGELSDTEMEVAQAHLAGCSTCEAERTAIGQARSWLRDLPLVEPPADFYERLLASAPDEVTAAAPSPGTHATVTSLADAARRRQRHRWQTGVVAMAGCAAATLVVLGLAAPHDPPTSPQLARFIQAHEAEVGVGDPVSELATAAVPVAFGR